jgi:nitrogen-specific signal transduction histidine kinase
LPATHDELRDLGEAINHTAVRLADYQQQIAHTEQIRTLGLLGAGLAHEMRNAATGCRLAVDLHGANCDGEVESLDVARQQLQLMENRLRRFLSIGKPNSTAPRQSFDLVELVESLLPLVRPMAKHAQVELDWQAPDSPLPLHADADGIGQGILNVLLNAIEAAQSAATGGEGTAKVTLRAGFDMAGNETAIEISDTGTGPPEHLRESLYQPFATSKPEGVGLGLAVASEAFVGHGGSVDWRREGHQTVFTLRLPVMSGEISDGTSADSR